MSEYPCKEKACAIQSCLVKNNYDQSKCQKQVQNLEDCCKLIYQQGKESQACGYIIEKLLKENRL